MDKCQVCGKSILSPVCFGEIRICKVCYIKAGGSLWDHSYEQQESLEKHRQSALDSMSKQGFPQSVIAAIDQFFTDQLSAMLSRNGSEHEDQQVRNDGTAK